MWFLFVEVYEGYVILLWHSLSLPYNYFETNDPDFKPNELSVERLIRIWKKNVS